MLNGSSRDDSHLAIGVWDSRKDKGYQLIGRAKKEEDLAYDLKRKDDIPQIQRKITVETEKILDFRLRPHTDIEKSL